MTVYTGNVVPYGSGGRWYTRMVITDDGSNPTGATVVHWAFQIIFENSISDSSNVVNWSTPWGAGEHNNFPFNGAGTYTVASGDQSVQILYGGGNSLHMRLYASGMATGGTGPSVVEIDYPLPGRSGAVPDPPIVGVDQVSSFGARIFTAVAGNENGLQADNVNYRIHRQSDGAWMGDRQGPYPGVFWDGLDRNTTYMAYAQVHNALGWSGWSAANVFTTLATVPAAPTRGVAVAVGATSATVRWSDPDNGGSGIISRAYQFSQVSSFTGAPLINLPANGTITRNDLSPGRTYYFRARVQNVVGPSAWSQTLVIKTQAAVWVTLDDGTLKLAVPYVNDEGGIPRIAIPYVNDVNGYPRPVSG